jgi:hypothetical protein
MRAEIKISLLIFSVFILLIGPTRSVKADDSIIVPFITNDVYSCIVNFNSPLLSLIGNEKYVEVSYKFDDNCNPMLTSEKRLKYIPPEVNEEPYNAIETYTPPLNFTAPLLQLDIKSISTTNTCHTKTWQTDPFYIPTIYTQNDTAYTWDGSRVSYFSVTGS